MSALHPTASASPSSFTLPSNTHSIPLAHSPHQQSSSPTSSPSTSPSKHSPHHPQGARDSSRRSKSKTPSPPRSVAEIPSSIQTQSPPSPHQNYNHRGNRTSSSPITNQFLLLSGERPPSPLTLTSALAPPSVMPMTAAGISASASVAKSTSSSRRSPAASLKLSMLPSASASMVQPPTSAAGTASQMSATSAYIHHQAYAHSLSAQHKLQLHQKEIISQATRAAGISPHLLSTGPRSPRLIPLGSPGPVTPLTLEDNPGGFFASHAGALEHQQLSQQLAMATSGGAMQS